MERKIFGGFGLALAILLGLIAVAYHSTLQFLETNRLVVHTHEVLNELETTLSLMKDAGFGHRGYVITGDKRYLEPYDAAVKFMPDQLKQIRSLTADNPAQQRRLDALEPLITEDLTFRAETIRLQRTTGAEAARRSVQTGVGKRGIEAIRQLMKEMEKEEHELLASRSAEAGQRAQITIAVIAVGSMLVLVLVASASVIVKRAINERTRSEEERNRFFTLSRDMLCTAGFDGYFKELNPAWEKTLGYTKEELLARPYIECIHPDDRSTTLAEAEKISGGNAVIAFENRYRCKDGSYRWFLWSATPVLEERLIYATARDVTERKRIEEQIAENLKTLADFKAALDEHAIVAITNPRGKINYVNDKFCELSKYPREELMGQDHRIINSGHHPKAFIRELWQTITSGHVWKGEIKNRAKDGSFYWVATTIVPFLGADGKPTQYIAIRADITDRKQAEEALREGEERFRTLANNISQLAWMADERGSIFWYNQRWFDYSGTTLEDMEGWGWQKVHHPDHVQRVVDKIRHCFQTGEVWEDIFPLRGRDGNYRWFLSRAVPIHNEQGEVFRWFGTNTDVTEQREAEEKLKKNREQLEAANKELEAFSYSVSHDLRAPLRHIDGFATLLQKHAAALDEKGRRHLATISESAKQMGRLIDDLLVFSHVGRSEMHRTAVNMEQLVKEVISGFRPDTAERKIAWTIGTLPEVHGDPSMLRQVMVNLIGNAVKYTGMREEARIEIGSRNGVYEQRYETVFFVRDNGAGFDMQYVDKLFGVFQRLHSANEFEGTGIGLANVRRIVQRHGGRTWAEGTVAGGATFHFSLPAHKEAGHGN